MFHVKGCDFGEDPACWKDRYRGEIQRRRNLEEEIKQFSVAFVSRQRSLASFHSDFKSRIEDLRTQKPGATVISSLGV